MFDDVFPVNMNKLLIVNKISDFLNNYEYVYPLVFTAYYTFPSFLDPDTHVSHSIR